MFAEAILVGHLRRARGLCPETDNLRAVTGLSVNKDRGTRAVADGKQEDDPKTLQLIASFLLFDGRQNEATLHMMNEVGAFPRLLELLQAQGREGRDDRAGLSRLLMDILYEMSRIQRVKIEDLGMSSLVACGGSYV